MADGRGGSATATINVTVTEANHTPHAVDDTRQVTEDMAVMIAVLANDTDEDGDTLSVTAVGTPAHGTAVLHPTGAIVYTPAANYNGADSFTYTVADDHDATDTATVTMTVTAANDAPVAAADSYTTTEDTTLTAGARVLANDSDADQNTLTAVLVQGPSRGTLTLSADGSFTYTPAANESGVDTFSYKANDGSADSAPALVTITVVPVNDAPVGGGPGCRGPGERAVGVHAHRARRGWRRADVQRVGGPRARLAQRDGAEPVLHAGRRLRRRRQLHVQGQLTGP